MNRSQSNRWKFCSFLFSMWYWALLSSHDFSKWWNIRQGASFRHEVMLFTRFSSGEKESPDTVAKSQINKKGGNDKTTKVIFLRFIKKQSPLSDFNTTAARACKRGGINHYDLRRILLSCAPPARYAHLLKSSDLRNIWSCTIETRRNQWIKQDSCSHMFRFGTNIYPPPASLTVRHAIQNRNMSQSYRAEKKTLDSQTKYSISTWDNSSPHFPLSSLSIFSRNETIWRRQESNEWEAMI